MCGIGGFVNINDKNLISNNMTRLLLSLKKRGPEGTSWLELDHENNLNWIDEKKQFEKDKKIKFAMGCSRLAINDYTDMGLQPISDINKNNWVALNGEIFNFLELKEELKKKGYKFFTSTDTEVIANAYSEWGLESIQKFNGQFAISILDIKKKKIFLIRDRLGIVPFFYYLNKKSFFFASEINAIFSSNDDIFSVEKSQISAIIGLPYKLHNLAKETLIEKIKPVNQSEIIEFDLEKNKVSKKKYWDLKKIKKKKITFLDAKNKLTDLIVNSVKIRLRTDRKVAFIVSGGIDSSSVLGIAKKELNVNPSVYSLDLPDERFNENSEINLITNKLSIKKKLLKCDQNTFFDNISEVTNNMDQPLPTPNAVLHNHMASNIEKDGFKVVLNGVGGDEVFFGYHDHFLYQLNHLKKKKEKKFESELNSWEKFQKRERKTFNGFIDYISSKLYKFSPDFLARSRGYDYRNLIKSKKNVNAYLLKNLDFSVKEKQIQDLLNFTLPHSIKMDDNCYFSNALEARQPYLDHRIVEFGVSLPENFLIRKAYGKFILRQSVKKYIPEQIRISRRKIGLNYPIDIWMKDVIKPWIDKNLKNQNNPIFYYSDYNAVKNILKQHTASTNNHSLKIWDLCVLNEWLSKNKKFLKL